MQYSKYLIIFLLCSCSFQDNSISNPTIPGLEIDKAELKLNSKKGLVLYQDEPFSGISISYYDNGQLAEKVEYFNGVKQGKFEKWFPSGIKSFGSEYKNGLIHGQIQSWWFSGKLRSEAQYNEGKLNGLARQWYKSGAIFKELNYTNGKADGMQKAYRENGKLYNNYEAKNGRIFGLKRANLCFQLDDETVVLKD